jgi:hypothetical protein
MPGQLTGADRPAARAFLGLRQVLGRRRRWGDVGDLVAPLRRHRRGGQVRAAPAAHQRRARDDFVGIIDQLHGRSRLARLLSRLPSPALTQRPVPALLLVWAVGGWRPRGCGGILASLPFQLLHPASQLLVPRGELSDQPVSLSQPRRQLRCRESRQLLLTGHTGQIVHTWQ